MPVSRFARSGDAVSPGNSTTTIELNLLAPSFSSSNAIYLTPGEIANDISLHSDHMLSTATSTKISEASASQALANDHLSLIQWLTSLRLPINVYLSNFIDNGYDNLAVCSEIGDADLDAIGVTDVEHRSRLLHAASELKHKRTEPFHRELERLFSSDMHSKLFTTRSRRCSPQHPPLMPVRLKRAAQIHEYLLKECIDLTEEHFSKKDALRELAKQYGRGLQCSWNEVLDILEYFRLRKMEFDAKCEPRMLTTRAYETRSDREVEQVIIHCDNYATRTSTNNFLNTSTFPSGTAVHNAYAKQLREVEVVSQKMPLKVLDNNKIHSSQNSLALVINNFQTQLPGAVDDDFGQRDKNYFKHYVSDGYNSRNVCALQHEIYQNPMPQEQLFFSSKTNHHLDIVQQQQQPSLTPSSPSKISMTNCQETLSQNQKFQPHVLNLNYYEPPIEEEEEEEKETHFQLKQPKPSQWRRQPASLSELLHQLELQDFESRFKANGILSVRSFHGLNSQMLHQIGIIDAEQCSRILAAVESLSDDDAKLHRPTRDSGCFGSEMSSGELAEYQQQQHMLMCLLQQQQQQEHSLDKNTFPAAVFNSISNYSDNLSCSKKSHIKPIKSPSKIYNMHSLTRPSPQLHGAPAEIDIKLSRRGDSGSSSCSDRSNHHYQTNPTFVSANFSIKHEKVAHASSLAHGGFTTLTASQYKGQQVNNNSSWMSPKTTCTLPHCTVIKSKSDSPSMRPANEAFRILQNHLLNLLECDGIDLASEPYTNQSGKSGVPLRLMLRYARECNKDVRQVALAIEHARLTKVQQNGHVQPISSLTEILTDHFFNLKPLPTNSVRDFMLCVGLPMYVESLVERGVRQMKDLVQLSDTDLICLGLTRFHLQILKEALQSLQIQITTLHHRDHNYHEPHLQQL